MEKIDLSIIIPTFKGEKVLRSLCEEIISNFKNIRTEVILINDCSPDNTNQICNDLYNKYPNIITYIKFKKNFGEYNAVMAGLKYSIGDIVLIMDDDYQNIPEEALKLYHFTKTYNFDVVFVNYISKKHSFLRNIFSKISNISASFILSKPKNIYLSSFKTIRRSVVDQILVYDGPYPFIDGLILSITSNIGSIISVHEFRKFGKSNYNFFKLIKHYVNLITNFSTIPIHICTFIGFVIIILSFILIFWSIISKFFEINMPPGYTSIFVAVLFFSGIQLLFIGLIGEYIGKILKNVNKQKAYFIDHVMERKSE
jgi:undecaprenyl-phosphate 4-deoxy-4-formamido-L-arabinose transferase